MEIELQATTEDRHNKSNTPAYRVKEKARARAPVVYTAVISPSYMLISRADSVRAPVLNSPSVLLLICVQKNSAINFFSMCTDFLSA